MPELNFDQISMEERGRVLDGRYAHFCYDWDGMTVDETTAELLSCRCTFEEEDLNRDIEATKARMREQKCEPCRGQGWYVGWVEWLPAWQEPCMACGGTGLAFP